MKCSGMKKMLSLYVDGELAPKDRAAVESHVRTCGGCARELEDMRILQQSFSGAERYRAPYGFSTRVIARAALKENEQEGFIPSFARLAEVVAMVVVIVAGVASGSFIMQGFPTHDDNIASVFSLDMFEAAPPDSLGGAYLAMAEAPNEK